MNRAEHLAWAKARALEYVERGKLGDAFASLASDLAKHPDTQQHPGMELGTAELLAGLLDTRQAMRRWIEGFQ